jgi:hypothetical protein
MPDPLPLWGLTLIGALFCGVCFSDYSVSTIFHPFREMEEVLNGYITNPTLTATLTELIKKSKKKQL